jgi:hypothetical protein
MVRAVAALSCALTRERQSPDWRFFLTSPHLIPSHRPQSNRAPTIPGIFLPQQCRQLRAMMHSMQQRLRQRLPPARFQLSEAQFFDRLPTR